MNASLNSRLTALEAAATPPASACPSCGYGYAYQALDPNGPGWVSRCFRCGSVMPDAAAPLRRYAGVSPGEDL